MIVHSEDGDDVAESPIFPKTEFIPGLGSISSFTHDPKRAELISKFWYDEQKLYIQTYKTSQWKLIIYPIGNLMHDILVGRRMQLIVMPIKIGIWMIILTCRNQKQSQLQLEL